MSSPPTADDLIAASYSRDSKETSTLFQYLLDEEGWFIHKPGGRYRVSPKGFMAVDELLERKTTQNHGQRTRGENSDAAFISHDFRDKESFVRQLVFRP